MLGILIEEKLGARVRELRETNCWYFVVSHTILCYLVKANIKEAIFRNQIRNKMVITR